MVKKNSFFNIKSCYLFMIIVIMSIISFIVYSLVKTREQGKNQGGKQGKNGIEIVISRYNEDLKWTTEYPFNKYKYIVYNKGGNNEDYEKTNVLRSYNIKNQGKCDHTYLYHIVHNYDNMADIVVFLPGCINECYFKFAKAKLIIDLLDKYNEAFFVVDYHTNNSILEEYYYFKVDDYKSMSQSNLEKNAEIKFRTSKTRPYGKWYEENFACKIQDVSLFGIMAINKRDIYNHEKQYYYTFMKSLEGAINDELSHYFEKSWEAVFYPLKETRLLYYTNSITNITSKFYSYYSNFYKQNSSVNLSSSPITGPLFWNLIYFINKTTYFGYIVKNKDEYYRITNANY